MAEPEKDPMRALLEEWKSESDNAEKLDERDMEGLLTLFWDHRHDMMPEEHDAQREYDGDMFMVSRLRDRIKHFREGDLSDFNREARMVVLQEEVDNLMSRHYTPEELRKAMQ